MLNIDVYSSRAVIRSQEPLTVGMVGVQAHFRFADPWKSLTKTVVFRQGDITKDIVGVTSVAVIPWEVLQEPGLPVQIGIYGSKEDGKVVIPTVWVETDPVCEGVDPMADTSTNPTLPVYQQLQEQIDSKSLFVVTITGNDEEGYTSSHSLSEIRAAYEAGRSIVARYGEHELQMNKINAGIAQFRGSSSGTERLFFSVGDQNVTIKKWKLAEKQNVEACVGRLDEHDGSIDALNTQTQALTEQLNATRGSLAQNVQKVGQHTYAIEQHETKLTDLAHRLDDVEETLENVGQGGTGGGGSGVHIGTEPPVDETVSLWVNPEGDAAWSDAAYYDETVTVEEAANSHTLHFPCPIADFHELHIHMTGSNAVSQLYMEAGGESTYLIAPQHGATSGTHIHLMATHQRDTMNLDVTTAAYSEHAQPGVPLETAGIGNEAASLRLYSKDGGKDLLAGMKIRVWGVYKTQVFGTLKVKNPGTGEWESLKAIQGERGKDGSDYILTEEDKQEIAERAAGLVDVPECELPVANQDTLGGVQPVTKTAEMTNPVGIDELGGLWSAGGGGNSYFKEFSTGETTEEVSILEFPLPASEISDADRISITAYMTKPSQSATSVTERGTANLAYASDNNPNALSINGNPKILPYPTDVASYATITLDCIMMGARDSNRRAFIGYMEAKDNTQSPREFTLKYAKLPDKNRYTFLKLQTSFPMGIGSYITVKAWKGDV